MTIIADRLTVPSIEARQAFAQGPASANAFRRAYGELSCLQQIEWEQPALADKARPDAVRVAFWNAERLKYLHASVGLAESIQADAWLLCELDLGMARSGNIHTTRHFAEALGAGHLFGVEFVELGLGDARERRWHAGEQNTGGLHGAGIVSRRMLHRPELVRLETSGRWFDGRFGERRVGGRMALMAEIALRGSNVLLVTVHYESHTDPADRVAQTRVLLDAIDRQAPKLPVLIGGDFNTSTFDLMSKQRADLVTSALQRDPYRLALPMAYEPMFQELRDRGYDWESCNVMGATTQRTRPDGTPPPPFGRIDWFFSRGLKCCDPAVIPAVDAQGAAISDHDVLVVTILPSDG